MIKRLLNNIPKETFEEVKADSHNVLSGFELIKDTKEFLDENYKGSFETNVKDYVTKNVRVSVKKYALFLNLVFKAVYGKEIITLIVDTDNENVIYKIAFNTSFLSKDDKSELSALLSDDKVKIDIYEDHILVKFAFVSSSFSAFSAISSRIVYNSLQNYLFT